MEQQQYCRGVAASPLSLSSCSCMAWFVDYDAAAPGQATGSSFLQRNELYYEHVCQRCSTVPARISQLGIMISYHRAGRLLLLYNSSSRSASSMLLRSIATAQQVGDRARRPRWCRTGSRVCSRCVMVAGLPQQHLPVVLQ